MKNTHSNEYHLMTLLRFWVMISIYFFYPILFLVVVVFPSLLTLTFWDHWHDFVDSEWDSEYKTPYDWFINNKMNKDEKLP